MQSQKPGGTIYAIGAVGTSFVKIGCTAGPVMKRLRTLQIGQPFPLQVHASIPVETDAQRIEKQVHAFLAAERRRGEWFEIDLDTPALEQLVVRAVQYVAEQEEQQRLARLRREEAQRLRGEARHESAMDTLEALLGLRIMTLLHRQQKSVYALAKQAGLPVKTVQRICKGEGKQPSVWTIAAIARVLGVRMDDLAGLPEAAHTAPSSTRPQEDAHAETPPAKRPRPRKAAPVGEEKRYA